jgi:hypothetical protein
VPADRRARWLDNAKKKVRDDKGEVGEGDLEVKYV